MSTELPDGWRDSLPEEIKSNGALNDITSIDQMATMIVNGRQLQANQVRIPSADSTPEKREEFLLDLQTKIPDLVYVGDGADMSKIYDRMGRPKDATGYELGDIPEPLKDSVATLAQAAHTLGMSNGQLKGISEAIVGDFTSNLDLAAGNKDKLSKELVGEYGEALPAKKEAAANFAEKLGFDEGFVASIKDGVTGLDNMKAFDKLMSGFESPGPRIGDQNDGSEFTHLTPDQAELQLDEILSNKEHAYWDGSNPAHKAAITKVVELTRAADAGKKQTDSEKFRDALYGRG